MKKPSVVRTMVARVLSHSGIALFMGLLATGFVGCSSDSSDSSDCEKGTESCPCRPDRTCDYGLTCSAGECREDSTGPSSSLSCGAVNSQCSAIADDTCGICIGSCCCGKMMACINNTTCKSLVLCLDGCSTSTCEDNCMSRYSAGVSLFADYLACVLSSCDEACQ